jgi:hypothetical protein
VVCGVEFIRVKVTACVVAFTFAEGDERALDVPLALLVEAEAVLSPVDADDLRESTIP